MLLYIVISTVVVGAVSLVGALIIFREKSTRHLKIIISMAAGTLLGAAFFDLLPEALESESFDAHMIFSVVLGSMLLFFLLERVLHWHHCWCEETEKCHPSSKRNIIVNNLFGDAVHNLIDGFLIASAFLLNIETGVVVTIAVILHEIPQEISDFGVLIYSGISKAQALSFNFVIALTAVAGGVAFYFVGSQFEKIIPLMAAFAAGNFIYLAAADIIPELHEERDSKRVIVHSAWLLIGVLIIYLLVKFLPHVE